MFGCGISLRYFFGYSVDDLFIPYVEGFLINVHVLHSIFEVCDEVSVYHDTVATTIRLNGVEEEPLLMLGY